MMNLIKAMVLFLTLICFSSTPSNASPHGHCHGGGWGCQAQRFSCGWDGTTWYSPCDVPPGTGIKCYGFCPCPPPTRHRDGPCIREKVCGSDGITYPNSCMVPLNVEIIHTFVCSNPCWYN